MNNLGKTRLINALVSITKKTPIKTISRNDQWRAIHNLRGFKTTEKKVDDACNCRVKKPFGVRTRKYTENSNGSPITTRTSEETGSQKPNPLWLRSDEPPRMEGKSHISGISSGKHGFINSVLKKISENSAYNELIFRTEQRYFPNEFRQGAIPALKSFFNTINDDNLRKLSILTTKGLYQKYKHWIEEMGKENIKVNLQLLNPFDTRVKDFRLYYGEMSAFDDTIPLSIRQKHFYFLYFFNYTVALYQNPTYDSKSWLKASYEIANFMRDSGFYATIDVEIDAEIKYTITQGEKELSVDQGRRKVVLSFVSPYYEDNSHFNIAYMQAVETIAPGYFPNGQVPEMLIEPKFTWKICDTDYLIQSDLERELRALIEPSFFTE